MSNTTTTAPVYSSPIHAAMWQARARLTHPALYGNEQGRNAAIVAAHQLGWGVESLASMARLSPRQIRRVLRADVFARQEAAHKARAAELASPASPIFARLSAIATRPAEATAPRLATATR